MPIRREISQPFGSGPSDLVPPRKEAICFFVTMGPTLGEPDQEAFRPSKQVSHDSSHKRKCTARHEKPPGPVTHRNLCPGSWSGENRWISSLSESWIQGIPNAFAQEVIAHDGYQDSQTRENGKPPCYFDVVLAFGEHITPGGIRGLNPDAEE